MIGEYNETELLRTNETFLHALRGGKSPKGLRGVWSAPSDIPSTSEQRRVGIERAERSAAHKDDVLNRIVERDPCPYCGTRLDKGKHTRGRGCQPE